MMPAPADNIKNTMVTSRSGSIPHFVTAKLNDQYCCDNNCIQWCSSKICAHTVASVELNGDISKFLQWYGNNHQSPNITEVANFGLPAGRGCKGGIAKRKRTKTISTSAACITQRPVIQQHFTQVSNQNLFQYPIVHQSQALYSTQHQQPYSAAVELAQYYNSP